MSRQGALAVLFCVVDGEIAIRIDRRGRCQDNIFIARPSRSTKYEELYLNDYASVDQARNGIEKYFHFYNHQRPHQSLQYHTPAVICQGGG